MALRKVQDRGKWKQFDSQQLPIASRSPLPGGSAVGAFIIREPAKFYMKYLVSYSEILEADPNVYIAGTVATERREVQIDAKALK